MILLPRSVRVFVATSPVSLRQSYDGLSNAARSLALDPLSGHLLVFLNRRRNQVKILLWTRGGFTIVGKRLERGTFAFAQAMKPDSSTVEIDVHELGMLLEGIDSRGVRTKPRWEPARTILLVPPTDD